MSAECGDCGRDIEYPPGSWPLGECSYCLLAEERDRYKTALLDARQTLATIKEAGTGRTKVLHRMNEDGTQPSKPFHWREDLSPSAAMANVTGRNIDRALAARSPSRTEREQ